MKLLKKLAMTAAVLLLASADSHATPRRPLFRRACVSPAPTRVVSLPAPLPAEPQRIPPPRVPVPVIPPTGMAPVVMPAVGLLSLPQRCVGGVCRPQQ